MTDIVFLPTGPFQIAPSYKELVGDLVLRQIRNRGTNFMY